LATNEEVDYKKILRCTKNALFINLGRFFDKDNYEWFNKLKYL